MSDEDKLPERQSIRLRGFEYARAGHYFVTICAFEKKMLFGTLVDEHVHLSAAGRIAESAWKAIPTHFPSIELSEFVIMPNHMHGLVFITLRARHAVPLRE